MTITVIVPTMEAERCLPGLLTSLHDQQISVDEIIIIDTSSVDKTVEIAEKFDCIVYTQKQSEFSHGSARNLGGYKAKGDILVFLTQDVLPAGKDFLTELVRPIKMGLASAVTARQIPFPDASPIEKLTRAYNYPDQSNLRTLQDVKEMGIKAVFFSNSSSAIERETFFNLGGFSEEVIVDEDLEFCARLLKAGYSVAYQSHAVVYHSHNYNLKQIIKRYFDIGVFFKQAEETLTGIKVYGEGKRYIVQLTKDLTKKKEFFWIPRLFLESVVKFLAYQLGLKHETIPNQIMRSFSGQPYFWETHQEGKNG